MPADIVDVQAGALADLTSEKEPVNEKNALPGYAESLGSTASYPTPEELEGPNHLRRISASIPWAVYTVAFVELCERFSYYGTQVVCMFKSPHGRLL